MGHICGDGSRSHYVHDDKTVWSNALMRDQLDPKTLEVIKTIAVEKKKVEGPVVTKPAQLRIDPEVSEQNRSRYENLQTKEGDFAKNLLAGEGLNHASFTRALGMDGKNVTDKKKTKKQYDAIVKELKDNDLVMKQGFDYFYIKD